MRHPPHHGNPGPDPSGLASCSPMRPRHLSARLDTLLPRPGTVLVIGSRTDETAAQLADDTRHVVSMESGGPPHPRTTPHLHVTRLGGEPGALPLAEGAVDAGYAMCSDFLTSKRDPTRRLSQLHRVVRPGGPIVIAVDAGGDLTTPGVTGEGLSWFIDRGFDIEVVATALEPDGEDRRIAIASTVSAGPPRIRVRGMRLDEAPRVGAITLESYDAYGKIEGDYRTFLGDPLARLEGCTSLLVAERDGEVAGTVTFVLPGDAEWEGRPIPDGDAGFRVLAVAVGHEGSGVGRQLVRACIDRASERGCHRIFIVSMAWMHRAHRLYERLGFVRRPDLDVRFPGGLGYVFTLDLSDEAPARFPAPGPPPDEVPWFADVWR